MKKILTVNIDSDIKKRLISFSNKYKISNSEVVNKALKIYLFENEYKELRKKLIPYAKRIGYKTDIDIYNLRNL